MAVLEITRVQLQISFSALSVENEANNSRLCVLTIHLAFPISLS